MEINHPSVTDVLICIVVSFLIDCAIHEPLYVYIVISLLKHVVFCDVVFISCDNASVFDVPGFIIRFSGSVKSGCYRFSRTTPSKLQGVRFQLND